jgi:hypothetical protein
MNVTKMVSACHLLDSVKQNGHYLSKVDWLLGVGESRVGECLFRLADVH